MEKDKIELTEKIKNFITNNNLDFFGEGSDLNGNCCVISGYALYLGITDSDELVDIIDHKEEIETSYEAAKEIKRVFDFSQKNNYGAFWSTEDAKKQYKF